MQTITTTTTATITARAYLQSNRAVGRQKVAAMRDAIRNHYGQDAFLSQHAGDFTGQPGVSNRVLELEVTRSVKITGDTRADIVDAAWQLEQRFADEAQQLLRDLSVEQRFNVRDCGRLSGHIRLAY